MIFDARRRLHYNNHRNTSYEKENNHIFNSKGVETGGGGGGGGGRGPWPLKVLTGGAWLLQKWRDFVQKEGWNRKAQTEVVAIMRGHLCLRHSVQAVYNKRPVNSLCCRMVATKCQRVILKVEKSPLPKGSISRLYLLTFRVKSIAQTSGSLSLARKPLATSLRQSPSIKLAASLLIIQKETTMTTTRMLFPTVSIRELAKVCVASCWIKRSLSNLAARTYSIKRFGSKEVGSGRFPHTATKTTPGSPCARLQGKSYAGTAPKWSKPVLHQWQREPRMRSHKQDLTIGKKRERSLLPTVAPNCTVRQ